ncbi:AmiS/UreI family transporter [Clostridium perfringens]|uniref:AmiS/UreI family transporter n=1 Tax=Clostridium perfringens TaxID=1502 RepID=UPI0024BC7E8F|nr:AmiS/UreI family transporter [Clostridium perfringens]
MLGVVLLYVGIVLISNGIAGVQNIDNKSQSIMNLFTGGLGLILNFFSIMQGNYYAGATGLLFAFTYLYIALNGIFNLDSRLYGWYSLFVAINSIPFGILSMKTDMRIAIIWWAWGILWLTGWLSCVLKIELKKVPSILSIIEGIITAWIPGFLMLINLWN